MQHVTARGPLTCFGLLFRRKLCKPHPEHGIDNPDKLHPGGNQCNGLYMGIGQPILFITIGIPTIPGIFRQCQPLFWPESDAFIRAHENAAEMSPSIVVHWCGRAGHGSHLKPILKHDMSRGLKCLGCPSQWCLQNKKRVSYFFYPSSVATLQDARIPPRTTSSS